MSEFRRLDWNAVGLGVGLDRLMDRAAKALADEVVGRAKSGQAVVLVCGKGNNGGDGFAAAELLLAAGVDAHVVALAADNPWPGSAYLRRIPRERVHGWPLDAKAKRAFSGALWVDCILGSGMRGDARGTAADAIGFLGRRRVISCDVPSGLGGRRAVTPEATVTFHAAKEGMDEDNSGEIIVRSIGFPRGVADVGLGDLVVGYPVPGDDSHKGDNGRLVVVGGGPYTGAPWYSAMAAYRCGVDLARVVAPADAASVIATWGAEPMVSASGPGRHLAAEHVDNVIEHLEVASACVIGPGLGRHPDTVHAAKDILAWTAKQGLPTVVDADGLLAVDRHLDHPALVLTPHAGEFESLAGRKPTPANVAKYAAGSGNVVLRKGAVDVLADSHGKRLCRLGHPTMTVGGTGDVLAGAVGAMLAKGASPMAGAAAALYLVNSAGMVAGDLLSFGATATDVLDAIPQVLQRLP